MLTSSGPICDICGEYILMDPFDTFTVTGVKETLFAHNPKCGDRLLECVNDWRKLPDGPLRKAYEKANEERNAAG